jgi:hypothetical protein
MTALGGCVKKIPIVQYPIFWDQAPKTVAVTPFRNETRIRHIGMQVTNDLGTRLSANGSYTVYDRTLLKAYLNEQDLQRAFSSDQDAAASAMVKIGKVQAILTGAVTTCNWPRTRTEVKVRRQQFVNSLGVKYTRPVKYYVYTNEAELKANAVLLRITPNGPQVIHSCPVRGYMKSSGTTPRYSRAACMSIARAQVIQQFLEQFAVIRKLIKVKPSDAFFTATGKPYAGEWPKEKKFSLASGQNIILVLKLPPQCDRNRFKITVSRKEGRTDLATFDVRWTKAMSATGVQFPLNPADLAAKGGGPGDYVIRLFSGQPKPVIEHKIKIKP